MQYGFLHIPKTGGTNLVSMGKQFVAKGYSFPVKIDHAWHIEDILTHFPKIKLALMLRDPLERMISGFNSRLRQGRPAYNWMWSPAEAAAIALLPSARHLLDAMLSSDELSISSLAFANHSIPHLQHNYKFYFKNPDFVKENESLFQLVGHINHFDRFAEGMAELSNAPTHLVREFYQRRHSAPEKSSTLLDHYTIDEITRLRQFMSDEYAIYHELCRFLSKEVQEALI